MKWKTYTVRTQASAEDLVADMLTGIGIQGVEIRDRKPVLDPETAALYREVMPEELPDDGKAEVVFYLEEGEDADAILGRVAEGLEELRLFMGEDGYTVTEGETEDADWVNNWKAYFHAFTVGDILIKPTWVEKPEQDDSAMMIEIDPGTAFGTGAHETTKLCITGIRGHVKPGDRVLDVGTGSGILSIVALKSGASYAFGTDIDPLAVGTALENAALNGIPASCFEAVAGDIITDERVREAAGYGCYDLVVSNILADVIIPLQAVVWKMMKPGAILIVSGIIDTKAEQVRAALLANPALEIIGEEHLKDWVSFTARRI